MYTFLEMTTLSTTSMADIISIVEALKAKVESLEENIAEKDKQIKIQRDILYQLIGGLFHHEKQAGGIDTFVAMLHGSQPNNCRKK